MPRDLIGLWTAGGSFNEIANEIITLYYITSHLLLLPLLRGDPRVCTRAYIHTYMNKYIIYAYEYVQRSSPFPLLSLAWDMKIQDTEMGRLKV